MRLMDLQKAIAKPMYMSGAAAEIRAPASEGPPTRYYGLAIRAESSEVVIGTAKSFHIEFYGLREGS